jgi:hypothetical protein
VVPRHLLFAAWDLTVRYSRARDAFTAQVFKGLHLCFISRHNKHCLLCACILGWPAKNCSDMPTSKNVLRRIRTKRASKVDFKGPLLKYIKRVYGDHIAQEAEESLDALQDLRNQIVSAGVKPSPFYHILSWRCLCLSLC